jgi:hypothetical protein
MRTGQQVWLCVSCAGGMAASLWHLGEPLVMTLPQFKKVSVPGHRKVGAFREGVRRTAGLKTFSSNRTPATEYPNHSRNKKEFQSCVW